MPTCKSGLHNFGLTASVNSPEEFAEVIKTDTAKWAQVIRAANIKGE